jgi:DNA-binding transcriptional ArsR family regulator
MIPSSIAITKPFGIVMVESQETPMQRATNTSNQATFRALADPTRREILLILRGKDLSIGEVAQNFDMTRAAVAKHLSILESGQLITITAKGRERINHLEPDALQAVSDWVAFFNSFWDDRLTALQRAIAKEWNNS